MNELRKIIRDTLVTRFKFDKDSLGDDTELFSSGLIDSLGVMDLVTCVEDAIGRQVPATEITLENFNSIDRMVAFIHSLDTAK